MATRFHVKCILSINDSVTNTYLSFLCNQALNFGNIAIIYMNGTMHCPIICQSGKKRHGFKNLWQLLQIIIVDSLLGYDSINNLH